MTDLMFGGACYAAGVLSCIVVIGVYVGLVMRPIKEGPDSVCCAHNVQHCAICQEIRNRSTGHSL